MGSTLKLLVVEDDDALRDALLITLEAAGHEVVGVADGPAALDFLSHGEASMVISDLRMAPMDGLALLAEIRQRKPGLPVLLMTAFGDVDKAVAAMRGGACDFMLKPFEPRDLLAQVKRYAIAPPAEGVIAGDARTREALLLASRVARSDVTVMLTGESGTGKEVFARYIHDQSVRATGPFIAINCAAIPESLLEATLFGYEKGAFTGAQAAQAGKFEQANGGTLLLDEISEMPLALQAKLLRVLQQREVDRVGGKKPIPLDIRVIATSNRDMAEYVRKGSFREDLFYRLNVFPLHIPSLAERPGDLIPLAEHFLFLHGQGGGCGNSHPGKRTAISAAAAAKIAAYAWPGNVRELENVMQRALILASDETIEAEHLLLSGTGALSTTTLMAQEPVSMPPTVGSAAADMEDNSAPTVRDMERQHILGTLEKVGGSRKKATELLGISERTLRYKLKQYRDEGVM